MPARPAARPRTVPALAALAGVTAAAFTIGTGPASSGTPARPPQRMVVAVGADPDELDPAGNMINFAASSVANALYDPLFVKVIGKESAPGLALSVTEAADRRSWTLKLRPGVTFHDGTAFDAAAVKFNLERQKKSTINGGQAAIIRAVDVVDPLTVKISVHSPYVAMRDLLSGWTSIGQMVSPAAVTAKGKDFRRDPTGAGTGPYRFKEWVAGDHVTVVRNPSYWGAVKPRLDEIVFKVTPDEAAQLRALRAGDASAMSATLPATATQARRAGLVVEEPPYAGYATVLMNNGKAPFDDVRMRRAVFFALDTEAISKVVQDPFYAKRGFGLWPTDSPWYVAPTENLQPDMAKAKQLVAEYEKEKGPVKVTFLLPSSSQVLIDASRLVVRNLGDAGIDTTLEVTPDVNKAVVAFLFGLYDIAGFVTALHNDPDLTAFGPLSSTSLTNVSKYKSAAMDAALTEGRTAATPAARKAAYAKVQQLFRRDMPFVVSSPAVVRFIHTKDVCGVPPDAGAFPAKTAGFVCR